jgi:phosphoenolpyruvate-protein kinase (PTS system EI component)
MNIRNATQSIGGAIDVEYEHPKYGWIPFTASPDDSEELGREIYALAIKGTVAQKPDPTQDEIAAKEKRLKDIADEEAAKSDQKLKAFTDMSPDEIRIWVSSNIKTQGDATDVIATLAVAVSVLTRRL